MRDLDYAEQVKALREGAEWAEKLCAHETAKRQSDAADAIEELLDELTTIRKQLPHWISVEERLPDHGKRVLAIYANGVISTGRVFRNGFPEAYDGLDENGDFKAVPVTHWMPLPAPPKEVE